MLVRDFMIYKVYTVTRSTTVKELIATLEKHRIGGLPVVDEAGILVGIVSDGDIVRLISPNKEKLYLAYYMSYVEEAEKLEEVLKNKMSMTVEEIMIKKNIETLSPDDDFESAIRLISKHHFKKLPVINGVGRVVGIISRGDIIHNLSRKIFEQEKTQKK